MPNREKPEQAASGWAPAKLILFGEHAVGYGEPALGVALSAGVRVTLRPGRGALTLEVPRASPTPRPGGPTPETLIGAVFGEERAALDVTITLEVPPQGGLGTSAALAIALLRARRALEAVTEPEDEAQLLTEAMSIEHLAHGQSSGLDPALVIHGPKGPIWFRRGELEPEIEILPPVPPTFLVIGMKAPHGGTARSVGRVFELRTEHEVLHAETMRYLGQLAGIARSSLLDGERQRLGLVMELAHGVLAGLGLVSPEVSGLLDLARRRGALGAKMTGAGGSGGAFYALAPNRETSKAIAESWAAEGAFVREEELSGR